MKPIKWQHNLMVLWVGNFITGMGFSMTMPFLPLYIATMGHFTTAQLNLISGFAFAITFLMKAIVSPYWGKLADQYGRKLMCLRASLGMTITITACGLAPNILILIVLRAIQGCFSGYINNANAIMAASVPTEKSGKALGTLATGNVVGTLLGPLAGGALASVFGYRSSFFVTGAMMLVVFLMTLLFVHEVFEPISAKKMAPTKQVFKQLANPRLIWGLFITTLVIQAANMSITPIISLLIKSMLHNQGSVAMTSGWISSLPGIITLIASPILGIVSDHIGPEKVLVGGLAAAIICFIPMSFAQNVWQLGLWRTLLGFSDAAMLPAIQVLMTRYVPQSAFGRIFSYNQSFQAMGSVIGPMLGSVVANAVGYSGVFVMTAVLEGVNMVLLAPVMWGMRKETHAQANHAFEK
ncbi:drug H(+) antiporter [Secundilactobacillus kimchicus JCM 15530]|uniref:Drug H(+) antiporter n=1 Tax=Secundilactobacillus kimchicus JCM 15530 TaxID=1302272 RepID=A0A0R1HXZ8_9LACO|nr:MFS transporter [Secundilactobacillus kimchicus]KRK48386.1 drug H(+) antiporter [Secundilactobacillus kimchicus JCM 15530]